MTVAQTHNKFDPMQATLPDNLGLARILLVLGKTMQNHASYKTTHLKKGAMPQGF